MGFEVESRGCEHLIVRLSFPLSLLSLTKISNTAQILTSLFEADEQAQSSQFQEPLQFLEEALQLLSKCLARQEEQAQLSQAQEAITADGDDMDDSMDDVLDTEEGGVSLSDTSSAPQDDRWATIVEPVTNDTILDTLLIQLETLTTLMKALPEGSARVEVLHFAANYAASILEPENRSVISISIGEINSVPNNVI